MYVNWPICGSSLSVIPNPSLPAPGLPAPGLSGLGCARCAEGDGVIPYGSFPMGRGLGYFSSGFDITGWGTPEWLTVGAAGLFVLYQVTAGLFESGRIRAPRRFRRRRRHN